MKTYTMAVRSVVIRTIDIEAENIEQAILHLENVDVDNDYDNEEVMAVDLDTITDTDTGETVWTNKDLIHEEG